MEEARRNGAGGGNGGRCPNCEALERKRRELENEVDKKEKEMKAKMEEWNREKEEMKKGREGPKRCMGQEGARDEDNST